MALRLHLSLLGAVALAALVLADESILNTPMGTIQGVVYPTHVAFYVRHRPRVNGQTSAKSFRPFRGHILWPRLFPLEQSNLSYILVVSHLAT